jgi:hypothetical protein
LEQRQDLVVRRDALDLLGAQQGVGGDDGDAAASRPRV